MLVVLGTSHETVYKICHTVKCMRLTTDCSSRFTHMAHEQVLMHSLCAVLHHDGFKRNLAVVQDIIY